MSAYRTPWDDLPAPPTPREPDPDPSKSKPRGRRKAAHRAQAGQGAADPGWLYHHLTVSGPAAPLDAFAAAACGAGIIPWRLDYAALEDDIFVRAVSQPTSARRLSVTGCRILARQFRERVEAHQARAAALVGRSRACPFDLHALLPVPWAILQLGPRAPQALTWLATHWGTTDRLHQVVLRPTATTGRRQPGGYTVTGYGFFTAGETPQAALGALAPRWPALRFALAPRPAD